MILDELVKTLLSVPVVLPDNTCYSVIELYRCSDAELFDLNDVKLMVVICGWMGAAIHQNNIRVVLKKQQDLNNTMINITQRYFSEQIELVNLLYEMVVSIFH